VDGVSDEDLFLGGGEDRSRRSQDGKTSSGSLAIQTFHASLWRL
jgi:hypothetical protein